MLKPAFKVQIGSETFEPGFEHPVISILVDLGMQIPADSFEIVFGFSDGPPEIKEGDEVSIQLGYEDDLKDVFKGAVDGVEPTVSGMRVRGLNLATKLLGHRVNRLFEKPSAGDIVNSLAGDVGIKTDKVSDGLKFPVYLLDNSKNAHEHIRELADKSGVDFYLTNDNKLRFTEYERSDPHKLEYGVNIISAEISEDRPMVKSVVVLGEGASSFKGAESWHWLTKKVISGSQEDSDVKGSDILVQDPSLKDEDSATKAAEAILKSLTKTLSGTVKILGDTNVKLGDTIEIKGMENPKMNGEFQVRSVEHLLSKASGFTTLVGWRK